ncbi:collagen binding domain-containing protein [Macrococcus sp. DPC7161]|uniref:MSCRAMM family protein n=1 Tax=Macrococcus sp. DPC7161 TaxID=2507060 RepID=UPI00100B8919|nr:SpaA isopeptide-forming pilin-related protein [Macrococcus sp. DPC7161]RXK18487.1 hypothetical protein ER639_04215 [Macrococcus sp. DPC7161]
MIKLAKYTFVICLICCLLCTSFVNSTSISANTLDDQMISVKYVSQKDNVVNWSITINKTMTIPKEQVLKLTLSKGHRLTLDTIKQKLLDQGVSIHSTSDSNTFELQLLESYQPHAIDIETNIDDANPSDLKLELSTTMNGQLIQSSDIMHRLTNVTGELKYDGFPSDTLPTTVITLVNASTNERLQSINRNQDGQFEFSNLRMFDDSGTLIKYQLDATSESNDVQVSDNSIIVKPMTSRTQSSTLEDTSTQSSNPSTSEVPNVINSTTEQTTTTTPTTKAMPTDGVSSQPVSDVTLVEEAPQSILFSDALTGGTLRTLTAQSTYLSSPINQTVSIGTSTSVLGITGTMSADQTYITWDVVLDYRATATKKVWYNNITTSPGISLPTSVTYLVQSSSGGLRGGTLPVTTTGGSTSIALGSVNNLDTYRITFKTPVTTPNLSKYTLTIGELTYDEIGILYNRPGISNSVTKKTDTPTINTVTVSSTTVTGTAEPGSTVTIKNSSGVTLGSAVADASGNYSVPITQQPKGTVLQATANKTNQIQSDTATTTVVGEFPFTIKKVNPGGVALAGATFKLTGPYNLTATTDSTGLATFTKLIPGQYTLEETVAPSGYVRNTTTKTLVVGNNGEITVDNVAISGNYQYVNQPILGTIKVNSLDGITKQIISGGTYQLVDANNQVVNTLTVGATGEIIFDKLSLGDYTLIQVKAPPGYKLSNNKIALSVTSDTPVIYDHLQYQFVLPQTGGLGPILFYVLGTILILTAIIYRFTQKTRRHHHV